MRAAQEDGSPFIQLDRYAQARASGHASSRGKQRGQPRYGRVDPTMVAVDGPSPPVPRYQACPKGCGCTRCTSSARLYVRQYEICAVFRAMVS